MSEQFSESTLESLGVIKQTEPEGLSGSHVIQTVRRLKHVKLKNLSNEDLRFLIIQKLGLDYLVPLALSLLEEDPLASGDLYRGDLLAAVLLIPHEFWVMQPDLNNRLMEISIEIRAIFNTLKEEVLPRIDELDFSA